MAHSLELLAEKYSQVVSEGLKGALAGGVAGALITKNPAGAMTGAKIGDELGDMLSKENHGKKTVKMSYGAFLAKYSDLIAKHTADFIDDDPENEDEAEQMAVDAVIDDLEHQGIHVELTNEGHDEKGMANKKEKYSQLSEMPFEMRKTKPLSLYCIPGDVPRLSHNTYHPGSKEIVPAGTPLTDWEKIKDTKNPKLALDRMTGMGDSYEGKHDETDMSNPEEKTEVHIAKAILKATKDGNMKRVRSLAEKLLKMHGKK